MKYYLAKNGAADGPYTVEELRAMNIQPSTLVWNEQLKNWTPAGNIPELEFCHQQNQATPPAVPNGPWHGPYHNNAPQPQYYGPCPKTWLVESILVTIFCCLPFGIVGIVKASQVESAYNSGNYAQAERNSRDAGKWAKWGFLISIIAAVIYVFAAILLPLFGYYTALDL